jgi:hypothetical protein
MKQERILHVVVASPSDVQNEREDLEEVINELNEGVAAILKLRLVLHRWETDVSPGFHAKGPQGWIDSILRIEDSDILIGIFWKRFGTPVQDANSGTEHEFNIAYNAWKKHGRPQIMMYFNTAEYALGTLTLAEIEQLKSVVQFKHNFPPEGLFWSYKGHAEFAQLVRRHLIKHLRIYDKLSPIRDVVSACNRRAIWAGVNDAHAPQIRLDAMFASLAICRETLQRLLADVEPDELNHLVANIIGDLNTIETYHDKVMGPTDYDEFHHSLAQIDEAKLRIIRALQKLAEAAQIPFNIPDSLQDYWADAYRFTSVEEANSPPQILSPDETSI